MTFLRNGSEPFGGVKQTFWGHFGPVLTRFEPLAAVLAHFSPFLAQFVGTVKPGKSEFFPKWPQTLWEAQTDLSGPFWARFDQFYGYTGYRILDTSTPNFSP